MSGLGFGLELGRLPPRRARRPSLLPAQTAMLIAGDSLAGQAGNGSNHPLLWAMRKGGFDAGYDFRRHNIAVGTTTIDADAALVSVTAPASESVRRGLIHADRLARDTGHVAATGAKVLLLDVGTNSVPGNGAATPFANLKTYVNAMRAAGIERVILGTVQPRMSGTATPTVYMTTEQGQRCRDFNSLLAGWAESDSAIQVYDGSSGELDPAKAAEHGPIGGGSNIVLGSSTYDGVHWGSAHSARREDELVSVLGRVFPVRAERPYSLASEYSFSSNRYKNVLGNRAGFTGAGAVNPGSGGPIGSFGDGWICNSGSALPAGVIVTGSQVSVVYGGAVRSAIRVTVSGTPASAFQIGLQKFASVPVGTDADNKLRMDGSEKLLHEWVIEFDQLSGCNGIIADLGIGGPGSVGNSSSGASARLPVIDGRYVWREPSVGKVTAANMSCTPKMVFAFRAGEPVSGSVTFIHAFLGHVA